GIELNPSYPQGHLWYLNLLTSRSRFEDALEHVVRCCELDPLSVVGAASEGWVRYFMRDFDGSIAVTRRALDLDPGFGPGRLWYSWPYIQKGLFDEALRELDAARAGLGDAVLLPLTLAYTYALAGDRARARTLLDQTLALRGHRHVPADFVAMALMAMGEREPAWEWLERAVTERAHWLVFLDVEPRFDDFRADPRFADIRRRAGI
ncbi:MAG TPA: hypothetical protein VI792_11200, partial [Candidatus Eisenbacteria bacterium]